MKLYGSTTSPYVRRIRILLSQIPHEFVELDIYQGQGRQILADKSPTLKVPCLEDDGQILYDSRVIYRYLEEKYKYSALTWNEENQLTLVDAVNDSFVSLFLMQRSKISADPDSLFVRVQKERITASLNELNTLVEKGEFANWHYPAICLYCLIDWIELRELHRLKGLEHLKAFREHHSDRIEVTATDPRN
ncbi:glutathione S-transferase family protein [Alteromonas lipotrueiana]|uniref:glutathione S-transferase family protein n=1 Tax=Alteromonas lipotrueiana TaxID=2803815 RepID=UPI001C48CDEA|nr:glutathione S-transferase family protein [Alteromonas lipotrueiana]